MAKVCPLRKKTSVEPPDIMMFLRSELAAREKNFALVTNSYYNRLVLWVTQMNSDRLKES